MTDIKHPEDFADGLMRGIQAVREDIAKEMLLEGYEQKTIARLTMLSLEEVMNIESGGELTSFIKKIMLLLEEIDGICGEAKGHMIDDLPINPTLEMYRSKILRIGIRIDQALRLIRVLHGLGEKK